MQRLPERLRHLGSAVRRGLAVATIAAGVSLQTGSACATPTSADCGAETYPASETIAAVLVGRMVAGTRDARIEEALFSFMPWRDAVTWTAADTVRITPGTSPRSEGGVWIVVSVRPKTSVRVYPLSHDYERAGTALAAQWTEARRALHALATSKLSDAERDFRRSRIYLDNHDVADARDAFFSALVGSPFSDAVRERMKQEFSLENGLWDEAVAAHGRLARIAGRDGAGIALARAEFATSHRLRPSLQEELWKDAAQLDPGALEPQVELMGFALGRGSTGDAAALARSILRKHPGNVDARHVLFIVSGATRPGDLPLAGLNVARLDLSGMDLREASLRPLYARSLDAEGADLEGAVLDGLNSDAARGSTMGLPSGSPHDVILGGGGMRADPNSLSGVLTDFSHAKLSGASFRGAMLYAPRISDTVVEGGDFSGALIGAADWQVVRSEAGRRTTDLVAVDPHADILDATFEGTSFRGATFDATRLRDVIFKNADLTDATFRYTRFVGVDLTTADLMRTKFVHALYDCTTRLPVGFDGPRAGLFPEAGCGRVDMAGATVRQSLRDLDLDGANLRRLRCIDECTFASASLARADMRDAIIEPASTEVFEGAVLDEADLGGVTLRGERYEEGCGYLRLSPTLALLQAKSLSNARLAGWTINLSDIAVRSAKGDQSSDRAKDGNPSHSAAVALAKLEAANLSGARLACPPPPASDGKASPEFDQLRRQIIEGLGGKAGVSVDETCASLQAH